MIIPYMDYFCINCSKNTPDNQNLNFEIETKSSILIVSYCCSSSPTAKSKSCQLFIGPHSERLLTTSGRQALNRLIISGENGFLVINLVIIVNNV